MCRSPVSACLSFVVLSPRISCLFFFFFNDTATTEIYTLSLHDALPISAMMARRPPARTKSAAASTFGRMLPDRKSTRLNSSHSQISYAVFCLKKKKKKSNKLHHPTETIHNASEPSDL